MNKTVKHIGILIVCIVTINYISSIAFKRYDLTKDKRYTLSESAINIVKTAKSPLIIDVFLEGSEFPSEFRRLKSETRQLLDEFKSENKNIVYNFIDPLEHKETRDKNIEQLTARGLTPMQLSVTENGKASQAIIFPWALASYNNQTVSIPLIKNKIGASQQELVTNSIQHLEYAFADGFSKLTRPKHRKIAVLKGNKELADKYIADCINTLNAYYFIAPFTLDSVSANPQKTLKQLNQYDLIIAAKPTETFTENEKFVLDQYTMNGGKSLWLIDAVAMEKDSLYNDTGKNFAVPRHLNLTDFFFKYGIRINPVLVSSLYSAPITLAMGNGSDSQFQHLQWPFSPLANSTSNHPIVNNLNLVKFDFANQIDTLKNNITKSVLLESAPLTRLEGTPREINLDIVTQEPDPSQFKQGKQAMAVLLEGEFTSVYHNRVKPFKLNTNKDKSLPTKIIVVADGDVIKNDVIRNKPQELGFDKWTGQTFGNKEFLLNAVNYLLDDTGLINIRTKEVAIAFLNQEKIAAKKNQWQLINLLLPVVLLTLFGVVFNYLRKRAYTS